MSGIWSEYSSEFYENYSDLNMYIPVNPYMNTTNHTREQNVIKILVNFKTKFAKQKKNVSNEKTSGKM